MVDRKHHVTHRKEQRPLPSGLYLRITAEPFLSPCGPHQALAVAPGEECHPGPRPAITTPSSPDTQAAGRRDLHSGEGKRPPHAAQREPRPRLLSGSIDRRRGGRHCPPRERHTSAVNHL
ncbi:hypothetical protein E2C01_042626 [Portunus trituberculatus]|uniref:Uncharacterized protein n=1 Tax=Portunus trituberculatus TaxID=210409 RepID=A0A5B7FMW2_PORTR|nr:hypothetical protein [Portunus trituberculatus]